ncbi:MAG: transcription/translation regulatory transformer protein RfaH [Coxiellaceae bacterium]|jgi:transcriptional antiterminator RfaH|nr:transcription/translation regulatory transformer protein RfaH [Coxiellaceae bacterium]
MASVENGNWYLVFTKVRSEFKAAENLNRQKYIIYLPKIQKEHRRSNRNIVFTEAFFPRYLFVRLNRKTDNWGPISSTVGVSKMVRFGGLPAIVPSDLIEYLKLNEKQDGMQPNIINRKLMSGDKVTIIDGPFIGKEGIYQKLKSSERVAVLLDIVGKNTQVILNIRDLQVE